MMIMVYYFKIIWNKHIDLKVCVWTYFYLNSLNCKIKKNFKVFFIKLPMNIKKRENNKNSNKDFYLLSTELLLVNLYWIQIKQVYLIKLYIKIKIIN